MERTRVSPMAYVLSNMMILISNWMNPAVGIRYPTTSTGLYGELEQAVSNLEIFYLLIERTHVFHIPQVELVVVSELKGLDIQAQ
jgi:hypothetical protein